MNALSWLAILPGAKQVLPYRPVVIVMITFSDLLQATGTY